VANPIISDYENHTLKVLYACLEFDAHRRLYAKPAAMATLRSMYAHLFRWYSAAPDDSYVASMLAISALLAKFSEKVH
jgi:hypothetical protein